MLLSDSMNYRILTHTIRVLMKLSLKLCAMSITERY